MKNASVPRLLAALALLAAFCAAGDAPNQPEDSATCWDFRMKDFVISAFVPPPTSDAAYEAYRDAGFNLVMSPRYELPDVALNLAQKHGLWVVVDTYAHNGDPWGGVEGEYTPHKFHHPATLPELQWLHAQYGDHPALAGYLLGDDIGVIHPPLASTIAWIKENAPDLFPWVCQCFFMPDELATHDCPIANPQFYPTLYHYELPAEVQAERYCDQLLSLSDAAKRYGLLSWPFFNVSAWEESKPFNSDSLLRFQVYASLAYGAQGLWYFTYQGYGSLAMGDGENLQLTPNWYVAREANQRVQRWGPLLLGRTCQQVFHSGGWPAAPVPVRKERVDKTIAFNWERGAPMEGLPDDGFAVTWTGFIKARDFEEVTFYLMSDDAARLWVDGTLLVDNWRDTPYAVEGTGTIAMDLAKPVPIRLEYYERNDAAAVLLQWSSPAWDKQVIPSDCLFTDASERETGLKGTYSVLKDKPLWDESARPGRGELVRKMSKDLLVGILVEEGEPPLAMIVDKRVDKGHGTIAPRKVTVRFSPDVTGIDVIEKDKDRPVAGHTVKLVLQAGEGQLVRLHGLDETAQSR